MKLFLRLVSITVVLALAGCSVVRAPFVAIEERLKRDEDVYHRHGMGIDLINVGDQRATVHDVWGTPRATQPSYPDFDVYLAVKNSRGNWRVLPGDYDELKRTTPLLVKVAYVDEHVNAIFLIQQRAFGNRRVWCDDTGTCGTLFPFHDAELGDGIRNPLIVSSNSAELSDWPVSPRQCQMVVYLGDSADWGRRLNFVDVEFNGERAGFIAGDTYLTVDTAPGEHSIRAWPNSTSAGEIRHETSEAGPLPVLCEAGSRHFVELLPSGGRNALLANERDSTAALPVIESKRPVLRPAGDVSTAATSLPQGTAALHQ